MMGKDLQLDLVGGVCQELGCFRQRAVLHAGSVDGQDVISHVQGTTPTRGEMLRTTKGLSLWNRTFMSFRVKMSQFSFT